MRDVTVTLKPCPFCGARGLVEDTNRNNPSSSVGPLWEVCCSSCGYRSLMCVSPAERDESIVRWNTRPLEDALRTRAEAAEAKLADVPWEDIHVMCYYVDRQVFDGFRVPNGVRTASIAAAQWLAKNPPQRTEASNE